MVAAQTLFRLRPALLTVGGIAFAAWQSTELMTVKGAVSAQPLQVTAAVAVTLWLCVIVALLAPYLGRGRVVEDELTRHNQHVALSWGYWLMIAAGFLALFTAARTAVPAVDIIRLMLIAGVAAPMMRFALMERDPSGGE